MNCNFVKSRISAFVDGELNGHETLAVREHVRMCSTCSREVDDCKELKRLLSIMPQQRADENFVEQLLHSVRSMDEQLPAKQTMWPTWRMSVVFAAAAVIAFSVIYLRGGPEDVANAPQTNTSSGRDVIAYDQDWNSATSAFPANTMPATLDGGR